MKKIFSVLLLMVACVHYALAGDVITHDAKKLPAPARTFISTYFMNARISHIKIESELFQTKKYEVLLTDRTEIDFNGDGEWLEVDCDGGAVPAALLPAYVSEYLKANFPDAFVIKIERKRREVEVELNNDWSLTFNKKGELIEIDD